MGIVHFKKPDKKSIMPHWAEEVYDKEEIATILYQTILDQRGACGEILELYFGSDESLILQILTENEFQPDFIYEHMNTDFGKGVIIGMLMSFFKDKIDQQEAQLDEE